MATVITKVAFGFRDSQGRTGKTTFFAEYDNTTDGLVIIAAAVGGSLAGVSNATVQSFTGGPSLPITYGTNAAYPSAMDKMVLLFQDSVGALHRFAVPAPKLANFAADGITVVNAGVTATLITAITTDLVTRNGLTMSYLSGWFSKSRNQRRTASIVKNPAGTGPAVP